MTPLTFTAALQQRIHDQWLANKDRAASRNPESLNAIIARHPLHGLDAETQTLFDQIYTIFQKRDPLHCQMAILRESGTSQRMGHTDYIRMTDMLSDAISELDCELATHIFDLNEKLRPHLGDKDAAMLIGKTVRATVDAIHSVTQHDMHVDPTALAGRALG